MRPAVKGVGSLAGLNLREGIDDVATLGVGNREIASRWASRPSPEVPCLWVLAYPDIGDDLLHNGSGWAVKNSSA